MRAQQFYTLLLPLVAGDFTIPTDEISKCSTKCSVTFDKDLSCFNGTLAFFEEAVTSAMRNFVAVELNIASILTKQGKPRPSVQEIVDGSKEAMAKNKPVNHGDLDDMYSVEEAQKVVEVLARRVQELAPSANEVSVVCPTGCEKTISPWMPLFIASAALNLFLFLLAAAAMLLTTKREERRANKIFQEAMDSGIKSE